MAFLRVMILIWADSLIDYVMNWVMQTYFTDVWDVGFTHAAGIVNVATGLPNVLPLLFYCFADAAGLSNYWMLLLSSLSYVIGFGFLILSTPAATGTCPYYMALCIGHTQKALLYTSLAFMAVGTSGQMVSLVPFFVDQFKKERGTHQPENNDCTPEIPCINTLHQKLGKTLKNMIGLPDSVDEDVLLSFQFQPDQALLAAVTKEKKKRFRAYILVFLPAIAIFGLPYASQSFQFGIPAICTLVAFLIFLLGSREYHKVKPKRRRPVTNVFKVILAATVKMLKRHPNSSELYQRSDEVKLPHTGALRFLDKAAIKEGRNRRKWLLCTVTEVEQTKIVIHMIPIWITLIICGLVTAMGNTFFVEQTYSMNSKVGQWRLPFSLLLILYQYFGKLVFTLMYRCIDSYIEKRYYAPLCGIALATISSTLCCIVAAVVETQRIHVIREPGNKPMTVFYLLPQFLLLAAVDSFYENSVAPFLHDQIPPPMHEYFVFLNPGLYGLGMIGSVLSVYVVGRVSERHGKPNWFQYTLNESRLDLYYWTIAALSAANFIWFSVYFYRKLLIPSNAHGETGNQAGSDQKSPCLEAGETGNQAGSDPKSPCLEAHGEIGNQAGSDPKSPCLEAHGETGNQSGSDPKSPCLEAHGETGNQAGSEEEMVNIQPSNADGEIENEAGSEEDMVSVQLSEADGETGNEADSEEEMVNVQLSNTDGETGNQASSEEEMINVQPMYIGID